MFWSDPDKLLITIYKGDYIKQRIKLDDPIQNVVFQTPLNLVSANNQWESCERPGSIVLASFILGFIVISGKLVKLKVTCMLIYTGVEVNNQMSISTIVVLVVCTRGYGYFCHVVKG